MTNKSAYKFSMDRCTSVCLRFLSFSGIMYGIYPMRAGTRSAVYSSLFAVTTINYPNRRERKHGKRSVPASTHSPYSPDRIPTIITSSTVCAARDEWRTLTTFHLRFNLPAAYRFVPPAAITRWKDLSSRLGKLKLPKRLDTLAQVERDLSIRNFVSYRCIERPKTKRALSFLSTSNSLN